jgi:DNA-binding ferritin-like protein (Dps family)
MLFGLEEAKELQRQCLSILKGYASDVKLVPAGNKFRIVVLPHSSNLPELPSGVEVQQLETGLGNPQDPSDAGKYLSKPMSDSSRKTFLPDEFQMGYRSVQDIVNNFAMVTVQKTRIASVAISLQKVAADRHSEIDRLLETVRDALLHNNYKANSKLWRALLQVQNTYNAEAAQELVKRMEDDKFTDGPLMAAKNILAILGGKATIHSPAVKVDPEKVKRAKDTAEYMTQLADVLTHVSRNLKRLDLNEESSKIEEMASNLRDIWAVVSRIYK